MHPDRRIVAGAQRTNRAGTPRHGEPVGRFGRPWRRRANAMARLERAAATLETANNPVERAERAERVGFLGLKAERLHHVLTRNLVYPDGRPSDHGPDREPDRPDAWA